MVFQNGTAVLAYFILQRQHLRYPDSRFDTLSKLQGRIYIPRGLITRPGPSGSKGWGGSGEVAPICPADTTLRRHPRPFLARGCSQGVGSGVPIGSTGSWTLPRAEP